MVLHHEGQYQNQNNLAIPSFKTKDARTSTHKDQTVEHAQTRIVTKPMHQEHRITIRILVGSNDVQIQTYRDMQLKVRFPLHLEEPVHEVDNDSAKRDDIEAITDLIGTTRSKND